MTKIKQDILNELKVIEKECLEKGISAREWIERYAEKYRRKLGINSMQKTSMQKIERG